MYRLIRGITFPGLLLLGLTTLAIAQQPTTTPITIDASRLDDTLILPGSFSYADG